MKKVICATYEGNEAKIVDVESTLTKGLPSFSIVGMANTSITEAKERVKSALLSNNFKFPPKRITINLAPSDLKKEGSQFDLSIALLIALDNINNDISQWAVFGELGLDGSVKENKLLYPILLSLANQRLIAKAIVPINSLNKLSKIPNIEFYGVETLQDAIETLINSTRKQKVIQSNIEYPFIQIKDKKYYYVQEYKKDFKDIKGQEIAKRAALISAVGFHNIILEGSPGCGKSMIAKRLKYILPPMTINEILEVAKQDILDMKEPLFKPHRNTRAPHHTSTSSSIFGGGSYKAQIGEIGLAHKGILLFDELPHFNKKVLEALREPMEDSKIRISRVNSKIEYMADFLFIGTMNPCPCGNLLDTKKECYCSDNEIQKYKNKLSEPFLDRIDLYVSMQNVNINDTASFSSKEYHKIVLEAFIFQKKRNQKSFNSKLTDKEIEQYCILDNEATLILEKAIEKFSLSFRSIKKLKKVARSIADIKRRDKIGKEEIKESLRYRRR